MSKAEELRLKCVEALASGQETIMIEVPLCWRRPPGFPRGELMCVNEIRRASVRRVKAKNLLRFLRDLDSLGVARPLQPQAKEGAEV